MRMKLRNVGAREPSRRRGCPGGVLYYEGPVNGKGTIGLFISGKRIAATSVGTRLPCACLEVLKILKGCRMRASRTCCQIDAKRAGDN
jgi:hypothetical protein